MGDREPIGDRYVIIGELAYGGLGKIYLAEDVILHREVVLKGLIAPGSASSIDKERDRLVGVSHDDIVRILDFVTHPDPGGGPPARYIVMEYLPGQSLFDARQAGPLELDAALAYCAAILPALAYLHGRRLLHCDLKPGNIMLIGDRVKLIDLGSALRFGEAGPTYNTPGYRPPESTLSAASDLFSLGRTLAWLAFDFAYTGEYEYSLPPRGEVPALARWESFDRLLRKATDRDPSRRFTSATGMRDQILGVLREVVARGADELSPAQSVVFGPPPPVFAADVTEEIDWSAAVEALPVPREGRDHDPCWRTAWDRGVAALADGAPDRARTEFDKVHSELPGELAPSLALALASEWVGDDAAAGQSYERVWGTDRVYHTAVFGLARTRQRAQAHSDAVASLDQIPDWSVDHVPAQIATIRIRLRESETSSTPDPLVDAGGRLGGLAVDEPSRIRLEIDVLTAALEWVRSTQNGERPGLAARIVTALAGGAPPGPTTLGRELAERPIRYGLEEAYRNLATTTRDRGARRELIDKANQVRPWTGI